LEDSYRQQDCPLLEEDSSDDESDDISSSSDLDDSSRKEDIFGKSQLPTSLTSRSELLLPTTDEKLINIIPKKLQIKAQSHLNSTAISSTMSFEPEEARCDDKIFHDHSQDPREQSVCKLIFVKMKSN
jgi:hypothetical protein